MKKRYYVLSGESVTCDVVSPFGVRYKTTYSIWSGATGITANSEEEAYEIHRKEFPNRTINGCYYYD